MLQYSSKVPCPNVGKPLWMVTMLIHFRLFISFWILLSVDTVRIEGCVCLCFLAQSDTKKAYFPATFKCSLCFLGSRMGWEDRTVECSVFMCINGSHCKRKLLIYNWRKKTSALNKVCASFLCWSLAVWTVVVLVSVDFPPFNTEVQALKWWLFGFC